MSTATSGRAREYRVRNHLADHGWEPIMRAAASRGPADLLLAHPTHGPALIQVGTANKSLGPDDRERFVHAAELCAALPILATATRSGITYWWVTRDTPRYWSEWSPA